jgi:hypothetical protein
MNGKLCFFAATAVAALMATSAFAACTGDMHVLASPADVKWGPAPPALPPGSQMAVMYGDPASKGFVSLRAKAPAGYAIPPHFHPTDEHVTVLSGSMTFGMGDKMDPKSETTVSAGGYFVAAAGMHHYAVTKDGAEIQVDLEGPFDITYVNPADDPRHK